MTRSLPSPRLVILQPTSLCNLDCVYCYVPGRHDRTLMSDEVLAAAARFVAACDLPRKRIEVLWHAGEPLTAGIPFYRRAFAIFGESCPGLRVDHVFQTNATLITPQWCDFFRSHSVAVGVSIDGPAWLHDGHRRSWGGRGTHTRAMRGVRLLRETGLRPSAICVLTERSLAHPEAIYDFFVSEGFTSVAFNIEESEGAHASALRSCDEGSLRERYGHFLRRIWERWRQDGYRLRIREFRQILRCVRELRSRDDFAREPDEVVPFGFITIRRDGGIGTFSPELISTRSGEHDDFVIGNVLTDTPEDVASGPAFLRLNAEVAAGRSRCRAECSYYAMCGAGFQSNRYNEHGSLDVAETLTCRLHRQVLADAVLDCLAVDSERARIARLSAQETAPRVAAA
jgi:uncharacterized protein